MTHARLFRQSIKVIPKRIIIFCAVLLSVAAVLTAHSISTKTASIDTTSDSAMSKSNSDNVITVMSPASVIVERLPRALITIRPTGFDPTEITVPNGRFLLAVDNKSGLDVVRLRLSREGGERSYEVHLSPGRHKWREKMNVPADTYVLTEAGHPNWRCRLTVTP